VRLGLAGWREMRFVSIDILASLVGLGPTRDISARRLAGIPRQHSCGSITRNGVVILPVALRFPSEFTVRVVVLALLWLLMNI
jgi:hypothetical protein